ncbi:FAD-binding oxidoreductase [Porticoccaceae bacterium LTM1]|nr:FAD-binding oxidoreductase [Porticoccaceae bacterium LTM1]
MSDLGYINSYYAATLNEVQSYPSLDSDIEVETCIIGGGFAGLMTALGLIERGHRDIAILEQHRVGWGASGRNGGFVFGGYSLGPRALVKQVGEKKARQLYDFTIMGVNLIRQRIAKFNIDCDLVDAGVIWANWFKDQQRLFDEQAFMREQMGVEWEYWSPEELREKIRSDRYHGGLFEPNAMHFHPLNYARGIAREISKGGGSIFENSPVIDIDTSQATKCVITERGQVRCKNLVVAGGGYIGDLCPPVARSILPISTYVMTTQPLGDELSKLLTTKAAIYDTRFAFDYYRPLADTRILWGGRISANIRQPHDLKEILKRDMLRVFPQLETVNIDYAWDGWMGYSRHQMVQIGELSPAVWYAVGFGGHGVAPTTAAGEIIASAITGQSQDYRLFKPWGLPWNGGVFGPGMAQLSYWWYQARDWITEKLE